MSWQIKLHDVDFNSNDFLIEDLGQIEKVTGVPWSLANPLREVKVARAFLAAAMLRSGKSDAEVETALRLLTLKQLKRAFFYVDDDGEPAKEATDDAPLDLPSQTSPASSRGASGKGGRRPSPASSALATA